MSEQAAEQTPMSRAPEAGAAAPQSDRARLATPPITVIELPPRPEPLPDRPSLDPRLSPRFPRAADWQCGLAVFFVLLGAYLLTYSGVLHSDDEMSMLAVTESLVRESKVQIDQLAWNQDQAGGIGNYGLDGELYSKYGLGQSLWFYPFYWIALNWTSFGLVQAALLLNAPLTALSATVLFWIARKLGYSRGAALLGAFGFGLGTLAWVYARLGFNEPAVSLAVLGAFIWLVRRIGRDYTAVGVRPWLAGLALGAGVLTRSAVLVVVPVLLAMMLAQVWLTPATTRFRRLRASLHHTLALALPVVLALLVTAAYNQARFGSPFNSGYNADEGFQGALQDGLYGFLISPGRSIFLYSPFLFLGVLGFPAFLRTQRAPAWGALVIFLAWLALNAKWHAWHGGWGWGSRLLLPAMPFLVLGALPVLEQAVSARHRVVRSGVIAITAVSVALTLAGVLVDFNVYLNELLNTHPQWRAGAMFFTLWDFSNSPVAAHLRLARAGVLDLAWWNTPGGDGGISLPLLMLPLAFVVVAAFLLWALLRGRFTAAAWPLMGTAALLAMLGVAGASFLDRRYDSDRVQVQAALGRIEAVSGPGERLLALAPAQTAVLMNDNRAVPVRFNLSRVGGPLPPRVDGWLQSLVASGQPVWLFQERVPYADPGNTIEIALDRAGYKASNEWFGESRLVRYGLSPIEAPRLQKAILFGDRLWLTASAFGSAPPGGVARVDLWWQLLEPAGERYSVSFRLTGVDGHVYVQNDRQPTDALFPTDQWPPNVEIRDRAGISLPRELPAGIYQLQILVYRTATGEPLPLPDGGTLLTLETLQLLGAQPQSAR